ncbi:MAG TPA: hypothetical protein VGR96_00505, partial [Acidobacteriaceae bacterium]|nr:hypothetical protein [Acidobacteriaceae bacterium]
GAITDIYTNLSGYSGRGVAVVGDTMYYTAVLDSCAVLCLVSYTPPNTPAFVYSYNLRTHQNNGALFSVANGLSAMAFDGTNFYITDDSGVSGRVYKYSLRGDLLDTIELSLCEASCSGLEYFERGHRGYLVANRGLQKGPYDLYDLSGNLVTEGFIDPASLYPSPITSQGALTPNGIAFDGAHFFTTGWLGNDLEEWSANGDFVKEIVIGASPQAACCGLYDLSFDSDLEERSEK